MYMYKVVVVTLKDGVSLRSEFIHKVPLYRLLWTTKKGSQWERKLWEETKKKAPKGTKAMQVQQTFTVYIM